MIWDSTKIISQKNLGSNNFCLTLEQKDIATKAKPGQFVELTTQGATLLNKPISIANIDKNMDTFQIVYKAVGPGTASLSKLVAGDQIKVIGPCGNGFEAPEPEICLIGGGIGIPPMYFLAKENYQTSKISVILGARAADDLVLEEEFGKIDVELKIATDDGSKGAQGTVVDVLKQHFAKKPVPVYACGPLPMLASIAAECQRGKVPFYACLEAYMGCGIGICVGCAIPTVRGMERVCKEGPVFFGSDVLWKEF